MKQKSKYKLAITLVLLVAASTGYHYFNKHRKKPALNPKPNHFIKLSGKIDPRLRVSLIAIYYTNNSSCLVTENWLEGVIDPAVKVFHYTIHQDLKTGKFVFNLPTDSLKEGYCKWRISYIQFHTLLKRKNYTSQIGYLAGFSNKKAVRYNRLGCMLWDLNNGRKDFSCGSETATPLTFHMNTTSAQFKFLYHGEKKDDA